ncbi:MAG: class I SAM-dependent methyltransferase [Alphaproteobacteria bacterium]|nr:MAG: class I SAM-dependent methyltransferase [Alphaproteobacteria bacterium]
MSSYPTITTSLLHRALPLLTRLANRRRPPMPPSSVQEEPTPDQDIHDASADYWTRYNVTLHHQFTSAEESLAYFRWRNDQYFGYIELMPVHGQDGRVVLDFGCGPGHDLVGFATASNTSRLIGMDVSPASVAQARARMALHQAPCELILLEPGVIELPLETASVDYVHTSGVLHHLPDLVGTLRQLRRILRSDGSMRVMVYNRDSVWLHLYVAYLKRIVEGAYRDLSLDEAFCRTTDGEDCPIARVFRASEFITVAEAAGFTAEFTGSAISMHEAKILSHRFDAINDRGLPEESRRFLLDLTFDEHGFCRYRGHRAGIDGCYLLRPCG